MPVTAKELSDLFNGKLEGNPNVLVHKPAKIEEGENGAICFIAHPKYVHYAYTTDASVLLVSKDLKLNKPVKPTLIRVDDVYSCVSVLLAQFQNQMENGIGIDQRAVIHPDSEIGEDTSIGAFTVVCKGAEIGRDSVIHPQVFIGENVRIGNLVTLFPGVKIFAGSIIGNEVTIHSNTIVGCDGFGYAPQVTGEYQKVPQLGNVVIEDRVEIGSNCAIDRATMGSTIIREGAKLDNLIQVAHNVEIGKNTVIAAQAGIAGSTKIGNNCMIGGQAGFVGHIVIADGSKIQAQSGVAKSLEEPDKAWYGSPAFNYQAFLRSQVLFQNLPDMSKKVRELEKLIKELEDKINPEGKQQK